jgi:hypothetical protein
MIRQDAVSAGSTGSQIRESPDTRMQQDERRAAASAVVGPYLTAVDGDHRLSHEPDYRTPPRPCHEIYIQQWRSLPGQGP